MSDKEAVLQWLQERGSITPSEAYNKIGCYRLGARIYDLRQEGHCIRTVIIERTGRRGRRVRYAKYVMSKGDHREKNQVL